MGDERGFCAGGCKLRSVLFTRVSVTRASTVSGIHHALQL